MFSPPKKNSLSTFIFHFGFARSRSIRARLTFKFVFCFKFSAFGKASRVYVCVCCCCWALIWCDYRVIIWMATWFAQFLCNFLFLSPGSVCVPCAQHTAYSFSPIFFITFDLHFYSIHYKWLTAIICTITVSTVCSRIYTCIFQQIERFSVGDGGEKDRPLK